MALKKQFNIEKLIQLYKKGIKVDKIANVIGCSNTTVWRRLDEIGIERNCMIDGRIRRLDLIKRSKESRLKLDVKKIVRLYEQGLSTLKIAKIMKCGSNTISRRLKEKGIYPSKFIKRYPSPMKGKKFSEESKQKLLESHKHLNILGEKNPFYGKHHSEATKNKLAIRLNGKTFEELYGKEKAEIMKQKSHKQMIKRWQNKEYRERVIKNTLKGLFGIRPTSYEKKVMDVIKKYNLPYKYVGDGTFLIEGKNPDFVNINGKKIAIEVFEDFFKMQFYGSIKNYIDERKSFFNKYGWDVIFLNRDDIKNEQIVLSKINI